jgi:hypothetical protein
LQKIISNDTIEKRKPKIVICCLIPLRNGGKIKSDIINNYI